jgi:hypothetical protein
MKYKITPTVLLSMFLLLFLSYYRHDGVIELGFPYKAYRSDGYFSPLYAIFDLAFFVIFPFLSNYWFEWYESPRRHIRGLRNGDGSD